LDVLISIIRRLLTPFKHNCGGVNMAVIVKNAVKDLVKKNNNVSADFYDALDTEVRALVKRAADRAKANGRKTIQARDL